MNDYMICYVLPGPPFSIPTWEILNGYDAMQIRVDELCAKLNCQADALIVLPMCAEIK